MKKISGIKKCFLLFFQQQTGNSDRNTVDVNWFSKPFAAQYVKIFPISNNSGICMRMDLFVCKDCK